MKVQSSERVEMTFFSPMNKIEILLTVMQIFIVIIEISILVFKILTKTFR